MDVQVVNFSHPLSDEQLSQLRALAELKPQTTIRVADVAAHVRLDQPLEPQARAIVDLAGLDPKMWQSSELVVVLPGLSVLGAAVVAEIHGRSGHFPTIVVLDRGGGPVSSFEVMQLVSLDVIRDAARRSRFTDRPVRRSGGPGEVDSLTTG